MIILVLYIVFPSPCTSRLYHLYGSRLGNKRNKRKKEFEYNDETGNVEPRTSSEFLKRIEDDCSNNPDSAAKLGEIRNKVLEKMKRTLRRERSPSLSGSVCSRSSSRTRLRSESEELETQAAAKSLKSSSIKPVQKPQSRLPGPAPKV